MKPYFTSKPYREWKKTSDDAKKSISYTSKPLKFRKTKHDNTIIHNPNNDEKNSKHQYHVSDSETKAYPVCIYNTKHTIINHIFFEIVLQSWILFWYIFRWKRHGRCNWFRWWWCYLRNFLSSILFLWFFRYRHNRNWIWLNLRNNRWR